jgi:hypothetical protein
MEATHAAYPIRQQTVPECTALFVKPLIHRGFPNGDSLCGCCLFGRDTMVFPSSSILGRSIGKARQNDIRRERNHP